MGLPANPQMAKYITVNRKKRNIFTVNRQVSKPIVPANVLDIVNQELNDWWSKRSIRPALMKAMKLLYIWTQLKTKHLIFNAQIIGLKNETNVWVTN